MTLFDKCPVCGGEIVEKEVVKIVRGGNLKETVKAQAEVCLRCGERFYAPDVVKRFKKIRSRLKKEEEMTGFPNTANARLLTKLDYEIWFLGFLEKRYDIVQENDAPPVLRITSGDQIVHATIPLEDYLFIDNTPLNAMMPLTFIACYKTLDMIFEWILEENQTLGNISNVPWRFEEKVTMLMHTPNLQLPNLFKNQPYLYDYSKALFCRLLPYRNEVIHNNSFSVSEDILTLSSSRTGTTLNLSIEQVGCLVRFVRVFVRALAGEVVVGDYKNKILRYYLDIIAPVHGLSVFNQQMPRFVHVELTVPKQGASFPADLKQVRDKVTSHFPAPEVFFDLKVQAVEGENLIAKWYFAPEEVPDMDVMTFYEESHKAHRVALVESQTINA